MLTNIDNIENSFLSGPAGMEEMLRDFYLIVEENKKLSQQKRAFIIGMYAVNLLCDLAGIKRDGMIRKAFTRDLYLKIGLQMIAQVRRTDPRNQRL